MNRLTSAMSWLILGTQNELQGTWTATKAEQDSIADNAVIGHRLSFIGNRFQIHSKESNSLYSGTVRVDPSVRPAAIDFEHTEGVLNGKEWKGIYALEGDTLTTCDNAPNPGEGTARCVRGKEWVRVCPDHVQTREALNGCGYDAQDPPTLDQPARGALGDVMTPKHPA
jgi:uncharacterized protein (TIGR03067 family)